MIVNPSDDVVKLVTNLYNTNGTTTQTSMSSNSNPFSSSSNSMNNGNNVFGGASTSLFNSSSQSSNLNPFSRNTTTGFGPSIQSQNSSNLFGSSAMSSNNLFGSTNSNTSTSLFNSPSSFSNTSSPMIANSLFGQNSTQQQFNQNTNAGGMQTQPSSIFGATQSSFGQSGSTGSFSQPSNASPFALPQMGSSSTQSTNIFGGKAQNPIFGGNASFGNHIKTGVFGQNSTQQQSTSLFNQNTTSGNIFGQNTQAQEFTTQEQQPQGFGSIAEASTANIFGIQQQPSPFQSSANSFANMNASNSMDQSVFGRGMTNNNQTNLINQQNPVQTAPVPAQTLQQHQQSIFGNSSFGSNAMQSNPMQSNAMQSNQSTFGTNLFQQNAEPIKQQTQQSVFGQSQNNFFSASAIQLSASFYSPMDSLSNEELEAFKANEFNISKIPTKPPPEELCR